MVQHGKPQAIPMIQEKYNFFHQWRPLYVSEVLQQALGVVDGWVELMVRVLPLAV